MHKHKTDHVCGGNKQTQLGGGGVSESRRARARMRETRMSGTTMAYDVVHGASRTGGAWRPRGLSSVHVAIPLRNNRQPHSPLFSTHRCASLIDNMLDYNVPYKLQLYQNSYCNSYYVIRGYS